jgi:predicted Rossmann fold nucleotide-binding protein DprA/Smf involved in DNA uptake
VLTVLAIDHLPLAAGSPGLRSRPDPIDRPVLDACAAAPSTLEGLVVATGRSLAEVAMSLARLSRAGWLHELDGWFESVGAPP